MGGTRDSMLQHWYMHGLTMAPLVKNMFFPASVIPYYDCRSTFYPTLTCQFYNMITSKEFN